MANVVREAMRRVGVHVRERVDLSGDNMATNLLARKGGDLRKVRHISLADLFIREATCDGRVRVNDCSSCENRADILTKVMAAAQLRSKLCLVSLFDPMPAPKATMARMARISVDCVEEDGIVKVEVSDDEPPAAEAAQCSATPPSGPLCCDLGGVAAEAEPAQKQRTAEAVSERDTSALSLEELVQEGAVEAAPAEKAEQVDRRDAPAVPDRLANAPWHRKRRVPRQPLHSRSRSSSRRGRAVLTPGPRPYLEDAEWANRPTSKNPCGMKCHYFKSCRGGCYKKKGHHRQGATEWARWHMCADCRDWFDENPDAWSK